MVQAGGVGFFGKLPGVGDFVQRRLPAAFVGAWDAGFEAAVDAARNHFGVDWQEIWKTAPAWRFALMPGVCGDSAWVGVMGPANDRVGRGFPMVLAHAVEGAAELSRVVAEAGGWFAATEDVYRYSCTGGTTTIEAFDTAVSLLPSPLAWLTGNATTETPNAEWRDTLRSAWRRDAEDRQLAALWARCNEARDGCMWWTIGGANVSATALLTRGLPEAEVYASFLRDAASRARPRTSAASTTPSSGPGPAYGDVLPGPVSTGDLDDVLADLLAPSQPAPLDAPSSNTEPPAVGATATPVSDRREPHTTLVVADNGHVDSRRIAAARVTEVLDDPAVLADLQRVHENLSALHPQLRARGEDLIDPVPEDAALVIARITGDCVELLRAGAASAWHWRRGQLRPLFVETAVPAPSDADTVQPGDLSALLSQPASARHAPGLGASGMLQLDQAHCTVVNGDRLLLMATDTLVGLPENALAGALQAPTSDETCVRIAAAAGLRMKRAQWPVAVIEVGT